jgi:hypothetical protein
MPHKSGKSCSYVFAAAMASLWMTTVSAQQRDAQPGGTASLSSALWQGHITAVAMISAQPGTGSQSPYLNRGLGATRPGLTVGFGIESAASPIIFAVELSTTTPMETVQEGRFVTGSLPGSAIARHRDTLLSFLPGVRWRAGRGFMEAKGGISLLFGEPTRDGEPIPDFAEYSAGTFALTAGFDAVFPFNSRISLIPSFRYSAAAREEGEPDYVGLGTHITRVGVGLRVKL